MRKPMGGRLLRKKRLRKKFITTVADGIAKRSSDTRKAVMKRCFRDDYLDRLRRMSSEVVRLTRMSNFELAS